MRAFVTLSLALGSLNLVARGFSPFAGPQPIAALIQTDPWATVIAREVPRIVVYQDGSVIFLKHSKTGTNYHSAKLSPPQLAEFETHLKPVTDVKRWLPLYNLEPIHTDQPEISFYVRTAKRQVVTRVYGLTQTTPTEGAPTNKVPQPLLVLHKYLDSLDYPDSKPWTQAHVEVLLWPYQYKSNNAIKWPPAWPALDSDHALRRGSTYSIFFAGDALADLENFERIRKDSAGIEIGGKKWDMAFRRVLPSQPVWLNAFQAIKPK